MDRTARQVVLATVAVLVIAVAAATLPNPVSEGGVSPTPVEESPDSGGDGIEFGGDGVSFGLGGGSFGFRALCFPFLLSPWFVLGAILAILAIGYVIYRRTDIIATIGVMGFLLLPAFLVYLLLTDCRSPAESPESTSPLPEYNISFLFEGGGGSGAAGSGTVPTTSPTFLLFLGLVGLVVLVVFLRATADDDLLAEPAADESAEESPSLAAVGAAAGRAADRIEGRASVDNEVFKAWAEMTELLDLERPETVTPGEFAAEATAAGMDPDHVTELTDLFQAVRYGGKEPTPERETRAVETLRKIETAYANEADGEGADADS